MQDQTIPREQIALYSLYDSEKLMLAPNTPFERRTKILVLRFSSLLSISFKRTTDD
jgi:hypothetical protein